MIVNFLQKKLIFAGILVFVIVIIFIMIIVSRDDSGATRQRSEHNNSKVDFQNPLLKSEQSKRNTTYGTSNTVLPYAEENTSNKGSIVVRQNSDENAVITRLAMEEILDVAINQIGDGVVYVTKSDGNVIEIDYGGQKKTRVTKKYLPKLQSVSLPNRFNYEGILVKFDGSRAYYNFRKEIEKPLASKIRSDFKWSPDGRQIIYFFEDYTRGGSNISIANPDGTNWRSIIKTALPSLKFSWDERTSIGLLQEGYGNYPGDFYKIDLANNSSKVIFSGIFTLHHKWSPMGDVLIYSRSDDPGMSRLNLYDIKTQKSVPLSFYSLPESCVWSKNVTKLFCFTENENLIKTGLLKAGSTLPQNIGFWSLDLKEGKATEIIIPQKVYDPDKLLLSPNEDYLVFKNKLDNFVYSIKLK